MAKNNFNDLKETLLGTFNFMAEKVLDLADTAADTAKSGHQIAKLFLEKKKEESAMETAYSQLGKLYYAEKGATPDAAYAASCEKITASRAAIETNNERLAELKEKDGDTNAEFDIDPDFSVEAKPQETVAEESEIETEESAEVAKEEAPQEPQE